MDEVRLRYRCPACNRGILNRKIGRCLYCGATLPPELLLSQEQVAELERQKQELEENKDRANPHRADDGSNSDCYTEYFIDIAADIGNLSD